MKKLLTIILIALMWVSCNKDEAKNDVEPTPLTNKELLIGIWDTEYTIPDNNQNGSFDDDDKWYPGKGEALIYGFSSNKVMVTRKYLDYDTQAPKEDIITYKWFLSGDSTLVFYLDNVDSFYIDIVSLSAANTVWDIPHTTIHSTPNGSDTTIVKQRYKLNKIQ